MSYTCWPTYVGETYMFIWRNIYIYFGALGFRPVDQKESLAPGLMGESNGNRRAELIKSILNSSCDGHEV